MFTRNRVSVRSFAGRAAAALALALALIVVHSSDASAQSVCPSNSYYDIATETCVCPSITPYWRSDMAACTPCPGFSVWNGEQCICPSSLPNWNASMLMCAPACIGRTRWNGAYCEL